MADRPSDDQSDDTDPAVADTHASDAGLSASVSASRSMRTRAIHPGDTLGRYEVGEVLGEGGMATVLKARDTQLRREVAVKVLFPHLARREEIVHRFMREARAAAGLEHANILRIYDVGGAEGDDPPFIVMEIIRGRSLLQEIEQRGPMLPELVACVGALLADALAAAHAALIVHRDIKPANVMIATAGGRLLLTDFGVARLETEDASLVTKTGALLGTPAYMSPEQASGDTATARSDLYSLGATLYQLATGALPYTGSPARVLAQIATGSLVAPHKKRPGVGPDLSRAIDQLMRTEPEQRTASAAIAASELRALVTAGGFGEPAEELAAYFADPDAFLAAKQPKVLARVLAAGEAALAEGKLPRAMTLADRASSLAPQDPAVAKLIDAVSRGGRSHGRRKVIALALVGLVVAGGGAAVAMKLASTPREPVVLAIVADAMVVDAAIAVVVDAEVLVEADVVDAAIVRPRDAAVRVARDAAVAWAVDAEVVIDAAIALPIDATPAATTGRLLVKNDRWCDVTVDGEARGRVASASTPLSITLAAGSYKVTCSQPTTSGSTWTRIVEVTAGKTTTAAGAFAEAFAVTVEVDVTIDGVAHPAGSTVSLARGSREVVTSRGKRFVQITGPCTLKADLQCYR